MHAVISEKVVKSPCASVVQRWQQRSAALVMHILLVCLITHLSEQTAFAGAQTAESDSNSILVPSTPHEFVEMYAAASAAMSAESVASFYHENVTSIPFTGPSRVTQGNAQQRKELQGLFDSLASRGISSLTLADYSITQLSDHFATTRLRWELLQADGQAANIINSTYVIRREDIGWRVVTILEMGSPHGL